VGGLNGKGSHWIITTSGHTPIEDHFCLRCAFLANDDRDCEAPTSYCFRIGLDKESPWILTCQKRVVVRATITAHVGRVLRHRPNDRPFVVAAGEHLNPVGM